MERKKQRVLKDIETALVELEDVETLVKNALDLKISPMDIVEAIRMGLEEVGKRYERREYFLMELIVSGNIATGTMEMLIPHFESTKEASKGKVVIGTVEGDIHDIGKNLVIAMLRSVGFDVLDLGVDVPASKFMEAVQREKPDIIALSCLLTSGMQQMKKIIDELRDAGLRENVRIMVGGRPITKGFAEKIGADAYGRNAVEAIEIARRGGSKST